jgi:salicylate hydroxylase
MQMTRRLKVGIIGAGIGGLATARGLQQRGHEVHVFERAGVLGELGAGLQLGPSAVKVIHALGLAGELSRIACEPQDFLTYDWLSGTLLHREPLQEKIRRHGAPYLTAHRGDLHRLLLEGVAPEAIHTERTCTGVEMNAGSAMARFTDGNSFEADAIIGADGVRSAVRTSLFGESIARYTHYVGWRGVVPMEQALAAFGAVDAEHHRNNVVLWRSPRGTLLYYPLRAGELMNVFAGNYTDTWEEESWTTPSSREELRAAFNGWPAERLDVVELVPTLYKWAIFDRDPLERWSKGRITLLGDAAHPMMPTLAQGAAIAIEDSFVLARALDAGAGDVAASLAAYEAERIGRASRVQIMARDQFADNLKVPPPRPRDRSWIFEYDATES